MSWTDKRSVNVMKYLAKKYKIDLFIETGTWRGINARIMSKIFDHVITCEKERTFCNYARMNLKGCSNVALYEESSPNFLKRFNREKAIFYLDAHFYDPKLPRGRGKFIVLDELKSLKGNVDAFIVIHDFDNNLGHIEYDGIKLDMKLLKPSLLKVNPNFHFYTNTLAGCEIIKKGEFKDQQINEALEYVWSKPDKTFRGILYALPIRLTKTMQENLGLREWN